MLSSIVYNSVSQTSYSPVPLQTFNLQLCTIDTIRTTSLHQSQAYLCAEGMQCPNLNLSGLMPDGFFCLPDLLLQSVLLSEENSKR